MEYEVKAGSLDESFADIEAGSLPAVAITRPVLSGGDTSRSAFVEGYLRRGIALEMKSVSGVNPADGGYAVPREIDSAVDALLKSISPIRSIANVVQVGSAGYRKLVTQGGVASGWAAEDAVRPETGTPVFNEVVPSFGDLYAKPSATQAMLDDAQFDVEAWLAGEIATEFAKAEGTAFVNGNGINRPKGFLQAPVVATADGARAFGTLQYVPTGTLGAFSASPQDKLVELVHTLRAPYRQGATWVMNSATLAAIRKFKTVDGAFIWQAGLVSGQPDTLLGYPVVEAEDMPDIGNNSLAVAFGNFRAGYLVAERTETRILRDPYSNKPYVQFYATKRLGGCVSNSEAIKLLKFSAT